MILYARHWYFYRCYYVNQQKTILIPFQFSNLIVVDIFGFYVPISVTAIIFSLYHRY
jgi:hypothetical protein